MKYSFTILILFAFYGIAFGKPIDENTAKAIGQNFLISRTNLQVVKNELKLELSYKATSKNTSTLTSDNLIIYFYVFNIAHGFIIVSGDDSVFPILGYSDETVFDAKNIPSTVTKWLEGYKGEIRYAIENNLQATDEIKAEWDNLQSGNNKNIPANLTTGVNPLCQTKWNQDPYENAQCPYDNKYNDRTVTGCPATAMAQIMKYWNYPTTGTGFHSYNQGDYGTLAANFGGTTYDWANMPNGKVASANSAVATLMYHCGVGVEMSYGVAAAGGSASYVIIAKSPTPQQCSEYAYKTYFGYDAASIQGKERASYSDANWISLLKGELDASRPIQYAGFGGGSGHTFVCDGYDNNDMFHMNWGWGGYADGYFQLNSLNPGAGGTGSGAGTFNQGQQAVIGIKPPEDHGNQTYSLKLYDNVTPSPSSISYGQAFSVSTNVWNSGAGSFSGDYCAAIFDTQWNFVDYVEINTGWTLSAGNIYTSNITFSNSGLLSMLPGSYYVGIYYRPTGGDWSYVADNGSYSNFTPITVYYSNDIEAYSSLVVTPGANLTQSQAASINFNIINNGSNTFYGTYSADLYNLDGTWVEEISTITESNGLPPNYTYSAPFLTFSTSSVTADPGTYLLAIQYQPNGGNWTLTGSTNFQNPIKVTVTASSLQPDIYENNNVVAQAFNLPISFSGNAATKNTAGSNCHVGDDFDYYKINLPAGYNYSIAARLHDSYNSGNGNSYSLDGQFTYSTDGSTWSDSYDDVMPNNITVNNGGTIYFFASPYFIGQTGTYLLDINITRTATSGVNEMKNVDLINVFPNPVKDFVLVDLSQFTEQIEQIQILSSHGQQVYSIGKFENNSLLKIDVNNFPAGVYFIKIRSQKQLIIKKIIINK